MTKRNAFGTYSGKYVLKKPEKYIGDPDGVVFRSLWEKAAFMWCERNPRVKRWVSEEVVVPYLCQTDNRQHRYFIDLLIEWDTDKVTLVEIKPAKQTKKPRKGNNKKRYLEESVTYVKNRCKWDAAEKYAKGRNWTFQVWSEKELKSKGILKW